MSEAQTNFINQGSSMVSSTGKSTNGPQVIVGGGKAGAAGSSMISQGSGGNQIHVRR